MGENGDVLMIQDFRSNGAYLLQMGNFINDLGYKVHVLKKLGNNAMKIQKSSQILEEYLKKNAIKKIFVISHSKGEIIAKHFLNNSKYANRVPKVISIASPFKGTLFAYTTIFNLRKPAPSSKLIKNLERNKFVNKKFINLRPAVDNMVIPNKNLLLEDARNHKINVVGHNRIIFSEKTLKEIEKNPK